MNIDDQKALLHSLSKSDSFNAYYKIIKTIAVSDNEIDLFATCLHMYTMGYIEALEKDE